ncbi:uncharacterized protein LOC123511944 [Portunus trituberculatus]|uniref:uncharacterized protein LOC123511944 n=1 Tax=Portunus trituberculatus TaxID=210409 RepID=UPI001E1CCD4B|nr:uncharacterized protein LOC123511944 [Portunus trituberculatus]
MESPEELYSSLVHATHAFYLRYISRPRIKRQTRPHAWTLDGRLCEAEQAAEADGLLYQKHPTSQHLRQYRDSRDTLVTLQRCVRTEVWHDFLSGLNHQTSTKSMWHAINRVLKRKPASALHHSPAEYAGNLVTAWSTQSRVTSLPEHVQRALRHGADRRALRLMAALLTPDEEDEVEITTAELQRALARGKATAPGDDGITYSVLRLLFKVPVQQLLVVFSCHLIRAESFPCAVQDSFQTFQLATVSSRCALSISTWALQFTSLEPLRDVVFTLSFGISWVASRSASRL